MVLYIRIAHICKEMFVRCQIKLPLEIRAEQGDEFDRSCAGFLRHIDVGRNDDPAARFHNALQFMQSLFRIRQQMNDIPGNHLVKTIVFAFEMREQAKYAK